jgi:hypothetical protein
LAGEEIEALAPLLAHCTLHDVVVWGLAQSPPRMVSNVVIQDEYTHDVVVPFERGRYLVYDTT